MNPTVQYALLTGVIICAVFVLFVCGISLWQALGQWRIDRKVARHMALCRHLFDHRSKGKITKIGRVETIVEVNHGDRLPFRIVSVRMEPVDFEIDCEHRLPAEEIMFDGERDRHLTGGYTQEELIEIAQRRAEFE